jgi:hypothetical protein
VTFRASEDSACLRPLGYRDRRTMYLELHNILAVSPFCFIINY